MTDHDAAKANLRITRLRAALKDREDRVQELERRIIALETSTTVQFGRLVAGAAREPKVRATRLPRELYRLWRRRHVSSVKPTIQESSRSQLDEIGRPEDRLLIAQPWSGLIVAGVLGRAVAAELGESTRVVPLHPHDAMVILDSADVDVVVVDAAAGEPGGPWAYLGVPGMYDREHALTRIRRIAEGRGLPLVLWGQEPPPGLAVLDWDARVTSLAQLSDAVSTVSTAS